MRFINKKVIHLIPYVLSRFLMGDFDIVDYDDGTKTFFEDDEIHDWTMQEIESAVIFALLSHTQSRLAINFLRKRPRGLKSAVKKLR